MNQLYKTWDMENTVRFLAMRHERVLVRATYWLDHPIRFRPNLVPSPMWIVNSKHSQAERWEKQGGVCMWGLRSTPEQEPNATLLCECPRTMRELYMWSSLTSEKMVVYYPPTWVGHVESIMTRSHGRWLRKRMLRLRALIKFVDKLPEFTPIVYKRHHG